MSQGVAGRLFPFRATQLQYRFQIVVYGFRSVRSMRSRSH
jgi:hypothetical protein